MTTSFAGFEPPTTGSIVGDGRFELLDRLGDGGTSVVYRARDRRLGREVALKLLQARYVGRPEREQRLINEAEYLRRVQGHANIVEFVDSGRFDDFHAWPWLATEILCGNVLSGVLVGGRLSVARTIHVACQLVEALAACHAVGLVHRDITPNNVFELDDAAGTVKLFDFSHAADCRGPKLEVGAPERLTGIYDIPGTHGYMGPEQVQQDAADPSMDVFGFGILLYELVTGQNPYANMGDRGAFIRAQRQGTLKPVRLHAWAYQAPEEFAGLVRDCTSRCPEERPTIASLRARLETLSSQLEPDPDASRPAAAGAPVELASPAPVVVEAPDPVSSGGGEQPGVRRAWWAVGGVALVVAIGVVGFAAWPEVRLSEVSSPPTVRLDPTGATGSSDALVAGPSPAHEPNQRQPAPPKVPDPTPEPAPRQPEVEPQQPDSEPEPGSKPVGPTPSPACVGVELAARSAARERDWASVLDYTRRTGCWPVKRDRQRLEVLAYANTGQWSKCVAAGQTSRDPEVQRRVAACKDSLE